MLTLTRIVYTCESVGEEQAPGPSTDVADSSSSSTIQSQVREEIQSRPESDHIKLIESSFPDIDRNKIHHILLCNKSGCYSLSLEEQKFDHSRLC